MNMSLEPQAEEETKEEEKQEQDQADCILSLRQTVTSLQAKVQLLERRLGAAQKDFIVAQYNILAGYLGDNRQPWFLYGIHMPMERRHEIFKKFYEKDKRGNLVNKGWPKYVKGILNEQEIEIAEQIHEKHFSWEKRKARILEKITQLDADLLSLVECDNYEEFFLPNLQRLGYGSLYKRRPRQCSADGCAIFYRQGIFQLEASHGMEFIDDIKQDTCYKDRVGLMALFSHASGRRLIFVSTHLARNPEDPLKTQVRAKEVAQLLYQLTKFATQHDAMDVPVMVAGDMNATNVREIGGVARVVFELAAEPAHPFVFAATAPRSMPTSVTSSRKVCIDYLLLQSGRLEVVDSFEMEHLSQRNPIPNEKHPSDHLPLVFRVGFKKHSSMMQDFAAMWTITVLAELQIHVVLAETALLRPSELSIAFDFFDVKDDGYCGSGDLATCLSELKMGERINELLQVLERQLERTVTEESPLTYVEFVRVYQHCLLRQKEYFYDRMGCVYSFFGLDRGSALGYDELREAFVKTCPFEVSTQAFKEVYDRVDSNKDGKITVDELFHYLLESRFNNRRHMDPSLTATTRRLPQC